MKPQVINKLKNDCLNNQQIRFNRAVSIKMKPKKHPIDSKSTYNSIFNLITGPI